MKLSENARGDAFCPVCALDGHVNPLWMETNSLVIWCNLGHTFDTLELSKLASKYEHKADIGS